MTTPDSQTEAIDTQQSEALYIQQRFLFMTLDPVHIGAGGYKLGRVDMSIAREPGTNLPKIPGTSLAGAARSYAALRYGKPNAAGQHKKFTGDRAACPIIYTFGTAVEQTSTNTANQAGTVSIMDAHILFFPVNSMFGPIWVSTKKIIEEAWGPDSVKLKNGEQEIQITNEITDERIVTSLEDGKKGDDTQEFDLNLGWLLFSATGGLQITTPKKMKEEMEEGSGIAKRIALVNTKLFSQIVNSNLEVRTSVSIDPQTGAAEQGALFTYEAIPRATWLWSDVIEDNYKRYLTPNYPFPVKKYYDSENNKEQGGDDIPEEKQWTRPLSVVSAGMHLIEYLGIGGMGTRGFGRMCCVGKWIVNDGGDNEKES
jgi:CRISPR-associated protein Cmr4